MPRMPRMIKILANSVNNSKERMYKIRMLKSANVSKMSRFQKQTLFMVSNSKNLFNKNVENLNTD